jgi:hypothetical protein
VDNPPGFPTVKTMSGVNGQLKMAGINVFGQPSRKESLVISLKDLRGASLSQVDASMVSGAALAQRCYVKWPYLQQVWGAVH